MKDKKYLVYQIYNKVDNKSYIGCTCNFNGRIKAHKKGKQEWQIDFNQHPENYEVTILEENINEDIAGSREVYYIDLYDAIDNGYNKIRHGNSSTLEVREKMSKSISKAIKGENNPMYGKEPWNKGKHLTEETKKKLSVAMSKYTGENSGMYGKHHTKETRRKISEAKKNISEETRRKMSEAAKHKLGEKNPMFGKHHNEETKNKLSELRKGKIYINNGVDGKFINPDELQKYLDLGYKKGYRHKE